MAGLQGEDIFTRVYERLEILTDLKQKGQLTESEYEELRTKMVEQMKYEVDNGKRYAEPEISSSIVTSVDYRSFGQLHSQLVEQMNKFFTSTEDSIDSKPDLLQAITNMAEKHAIHTGEIRKLIKIVDIITTPLTAPDNEPKEKLITEIIALLSSLYGTCSEIIANPSSSPAAKAIAEIVLQSATENMNQAQQQQNTPSARKWWRVVYHDTAGAIMGGSVALSYAPLLTNVTTSTLAAIGVAVNATFASARAVGILKTP